VDQDQQDTSTGDAPVADDAKPGGRSALRGLLDIAQTVILTLVIFVVIQVLIAQPFQVEQFSMEHTFEPGDYVLVDKLTPRWDDFSRGDVVVFRPPTGWDDRGAPFIKRVIGVAGDTVEVRDDGLVHVNGVALAEPYLFTNDEGVVGPTTVDGDATWTIPAGQLFVMGDHREQSNDSRAFGPIAVSSVIGRGFLRYWPLASFGIVQTPAYPGVPAP